MAGNPTDSGRAARRRRPAPLADTPVAREIDANLRRVYEATLEEEVPDRFLDLLAQLRQKEEGGR